MTGPGAVVALGDDALESPVVDGVVFHHHGELLVLGVEGGAFRHGPALEHAVELQTEVPVEV